MNGVITTCAGGLGHLGNSMFQYAVARAYAEKIGAELRIGHWFGRDIFENINEGVDDEFHLPVLKDEKLTGETNVHLSGYFQRQEHVGLLSRAKLKEWFKPKGKYAKKLGFPLVYHKRRGDYITAGNFALINDASYDVAARKFDYDPAYAHVMSDAKGLRNEDQYDDFFEMVASDVIFRANSTYSWWAATLSDAEVYSPVVGDRCGWIDCDFVPGNHSRMVHLFTDLHLPD